MKQVDVEEQDNDDDQDVEDKDQQIFDDMVYLAEAKRLLDEQRKAQADAIVIQAAFDEISKLPRAADKIDDDEDATTKKTKHTEAAKQQQQPQESATSATNDTDMEGIEIQIQTITPKKIDNLAPCGRIGLVALATDFNIEDDLRRMFPSSVSCFTSRVKNCNPCTMANLKAMAPGITQAADTILPGVHLDAYIYGCTSGTVAIGNDQVTALVQKARPNALVTNPITAVLSAFDTLQVKKLSILTPYEPDVSNEVVHFFQSQGFDVLNAAGFGFSNDSEMTYISPEDIQEAAVSLCHPDADVLFISCTALRASLVLEKIEQAIGKPVVSSNQALVWHTLQLVHYNQPIQGFGTLLSKHF